jgi:hypothetical protein
MKSRGHKIKLVGAVILAGLLSVTALASAPSQGALLRFHSGKGDTADYKFTVSGTAIIDGKKTDFSMAAKCQVTFGAASDKGQPILAQLLAVTAKTTTNGKSEDHALTSMKLGYTVNSCGQSLTARLLEGTPPFVPSAQVSFSPDDVDFLIDLPDKPVGVGGHWKGKPKSFSDGKGTTRMTSAYTLQGDPVFQGRKCLKIQRIIDSPLGESSPDNKSHLKSVTLFLFDSERGLVLSATTKDTLTATFTETSGSAKGSARSHSLSFSMDRQSVLTKFVPAK